MRQMIEFEEHGYKWIRKFFIWIHTSSEIVNLEDREDEEATDKNNDQQNKVNF